MGIEELLIDLLQHPFGHALASRDIMAAVHQHLGLDDRHDVGLLAKRGVAGERMGVRQDAGIARLVLADVDDGAPFRETRAERVIPFQPAGEAVEPLGDGLARAERQRLRPGIDLDAGNRARILDQLDERRAVLRLLADGLVEEDHARDMRLHRLASSGKGARDNRGGSPRYW